MIIFMVLLRRFHRGVRRLKFELDLNSYLNSSMAYMVWMIVFYTWSVLLDQ